MRPLEGDCDLKLHKFDEPEGKEVFWHSSAHILGEALESLYGARLTHGPPTDGGFFYDSFMGGSQTADILLHWRRQQIDIGHSPMWKRYSGDAHAHILPT